MAQLDRGRSVSRRPGTMTAVMRAVAQPDGPRVLRLALVERGRVVDERIFGVGEHVTVGPNEQASLLVLGADALRRAFRLFEASDEGYTLRLAPGMAGRLAQGGSVHQIDELARASSVRAPAQLRLTPDARGKLVIGDTTLLFQLVPAPPAHPRPQLPMAVKKGLAGDVDWMTTVVAAFSFLLHFFGVALVYSDWMDPTVDDSYLVGQLVESARSLPAPPPLDRRQVELEVAGTAAATTEGRRAKAATSTRGRKGYAQSSAKAGDRPASDRPSADSRAADIISELAGLEMHTLIALNDAGPATGVVLDSSEVPSGLLDDAAHSAAGTRHSEGPMLSGLDGRGSDAVRPGEGSDRGLDRIGDGRGRQGQDAATVAGSARPVQGPRGDAAITGTGQTGGTVANAQSVVARMRGRFRGCYQGGLNDHPEMQGSVGLLAKIGPSGQVMSVSGGGGGLAPIMGCLKAVVRSGGFSPPLGGGNGLVSISIHFRLIAP